MKTFPLFPAIIITVFSWTLVAPPATAGTGGPGWAQRQTPATSGGTPSQPPSQVWAIITSVDPVTNTIQFKEPNGTIHTYKIEPRCTVMVNFASGTFDQIKVGMQVDRFHAGDAHTLNLLQVHEVKPAPATPTP
jgi:hypothetical protein